MSYHSVSVLAYGIAFHETLPAFLNGFSGFADYARTRAGLPSFESPDFDDDAFHEFLTKFPATSIVEIGNGEGEILTMIAANGAIHESFDGEAIEIGDLTVDKEVAHEFAEWMISVGLGDMKPKWYLLNVPVDLTDFEIIDPVDGTVL